jgi:hypothetical protein
MAINSRTRQADVAPAIGIAVAYSRELEASGITLGEEHKKNARPSSREKHTKGQARKSQDAGGEKGDRRRKKQQQKRLFQILATANPDTVLTS